MVHDLKIETLNVWHVTRKLNSDDLAPAIAKDLITRDPTFQDQDALRGTVVLPNQILPAIIVAHMERHAVNGGALLIRQINRRLKTTDNYCGRILSIRHGALPR